MSRDFKLMFVFVAMWESIPCAHCYFQFHESILYMQKESWMEVIYEKKKIQANVAFDIKEKERKNQGRHKDPSPDNENESETNLSIRDLYKDIFILCWMFLFFFLLLNLPIAPVKALKQKL